MVDDFQLTRKGFGLLIRDKSGKVYNEGKE